MPPRFRQRREAGEILAGKLLKFTGRPDVLVLGLPRGGVPVAHAVAQGLDLPLDVLVVRKLGIPGQEEVAFGAIAGDDVQVLNPTIIAACGLDGAAIARVTAREQRELARRELAYRDGRPPLRVKNRTVLLVDDGIATGATVRAALAWLQKKGAGRVVVAAPVIAQEARAELGREADEVVAVCVPAEFHGVGEWYDDFSQTTDAEVLPCLRVPAHRPRTGKGPSQFPPSLGQGLRSMARGAGLPCGAEPGNRFPAGRSTNWSTIS